MGAIYGGSVTSILFNTPGTPMSAASAFDGYPMALKGQGARALAGSALSAFIAGTVCIILFTFFARPIAEYALTWGPPEYFSVMILAYAALAGLEGGSVIKTSVSVLIGLILTGIGVDVITGMPRITYGSTNLLAGIQFPLVTLGIPGSPTAAVILGALMIWGLQPGPLLMLDHPEIVWGFIASMYIAAVLSMVLNLFCIPLWTQILRIPFTVQVPLIVFLCYIGGYTENNTLFTMWMVLVFGVIGFLFKKFGYPLAPLVVAVVLGDDTESSFRRSLILSRGSPAIFFTRPVSLVLLLLALALFLFPVVSPAMKRWRQRPARSARIAAAAGGEPSSRAVETGAGPGTQGPA